MDITSKAELQKWYRNPETWSNILLILLSMCGLFVSIADFTGVLEALPYVKEKIPVATLLLVSALVTSLLVERSSQNRWLTIRLTEILQRSQSNSKFNRLIDHVGFRNFFEDLPDLISRAETEYHNFVPRILSAKRDVYIVTTTSAYHVIESEATIVSICKKGITFRLLLLAPYEDNFEPNVVLKSYSTLVKEDFGAVLQELLVYINKTKKLKDRIVAMGGKMDVRISSRLPTTLYFGIDAMEPDGTIQVTFLIPDCVEGDAPIYVFENKRESKVYNRLFKGHELLWEQADDIDNVISAIESSQIIGNKVPSLKKNNIKKHQ